MLRALFDSPPEVAVLMTGDGGGYDRRRGFLADLARMADRGWGVETLAWDLTCNARLKTWSLANGVFIRLEDYYESVTFLEGHRRLSRPLSLKRRPLAAPKRRDRHAADTPTPRWAA
jgi:hypothetical protein